MRRICWLLLLLFAFAIPWEYSLDLGEPLGNIARVAGLLVLLTAIPATLQTGRLRTPGPMLWLVLALYLWFCCSTFWSIEPAVTLDKIRSFFQVMMVVWLVWEFAESAGDLRALLRATVAGSWVLALLTLANFASAEAIASDQIRFAANGQDPNDLARFLDLAFPLAALLANCERRWPWRLLAFGYLPLGFAAVLLTASREGFLAAVVALVGSCILLTTGHPKRLLAGALALPPALWFTVPHGTLQRIATINEQLQRGDLNQRLNIWHAGWHAFTRAPFFGTGAGSFVSAAGLAPVDTAHNTALSIAVSGGLVALFIATAIVFSAIWSIARTCGPLRWALGTTLLVWLIISLVATVEESRTTWLLMAVIALAARLAVEDPEGLNACFSAGARSWLP
jgi:O-antigen ligase